MKIFQRKRVELLKETHQPLQSSPCKDQTRAHTHASSSRPRMMIIPAFLRNKRSMVLLAVLLCAIMVSSNILNSYTDESGLFSWKTTSSKNWTPTGEAPTTLLATARNSIAASWAKNRSREETLLIANTPKLAVLRIWEEYKAQHSNERLLEEWEYHQRTNTTTNRNFAVVFYSCPLQAGNRLHHFLNGVVWAVITNRTLLWNYYDRESCRRLGKGFSRRICTALNTEKDCSQILERAPWIPSSHWLNTFNLLDQPPELLSMWSTLPPHPGHRQWKKGDEKYQGLADTTKSRVVIFNQMFSALGAAPLQKNKTYREKLLLTDQARERAVSIVSNGAEFLLGLIFRESFALRDEILPTSFLLDGTTPTDTLGNKSYSFSTDHLTFALHSRHWEGTDDGSKIGAEVECLEKMLGNISHAESCQVFLMSDRTKSLGALTSYLQGRNDSCHAVVVANHRQGKSFTGEHGPFAGIGFFQDLYMASHARHGLGARLASSFALVRELAEYDRQMEAIQNNRWPPPKLPFCTFPKKPYA
jgi:hypothetical protein